MTVTLVRNMGASVRQRLLNQGKAKGKLFSEVLQFYAMERFIYRLSVSARADKFLLKGALLLTVWKAPTSRPTMDIDLLGNTDNGVEAVMGLMREVALFGVPADGVIFDPSSFAGEAIREDADYAGVRTTFTASVDRARVAMQIDTGLGDVVTPGPERLMYPTILDFPAPLLSGYTRETVMAEKLQALTQLRMANTRMKDYFDLSLLSRQPEVNRTTLRAAILRTFQNRKMEVDPSPIGLSDEFGEDPAKQTQWKAFLNRSYLTQAAANLDEVVDELRQFFEPILVGNRL